MDSPKSGGSVDDNYGVDYVLHYKIPANEKAEAEAGYVELIKALTTVGLASEVRCASKESLFVFVKIASSELLRNQIYRSRLQDWLHGVRSASPDHDVAKTLENEPVTEAERLRLVYLMMIKPENEGGAGIMENSGKWKYVDAIFPLQNRAFNKAWISNWSGNYLLQESEIHGIREKFGENITMYFVFLRSYLRFLAIPSAVGFGAWLCLGQFSMIYAVATCLWSVIFFEYWKKKELDLAVQWGVRRVSEIQHPRPEFQWEYEKEDPVTGEALRVYPPVKRLQTQLLQVPFALACVLALGSLSLTAISLEIFINEVYNGPGKQYLTFVPTVILVVCTPIISTILMSAAKALTDRENYATVDAYHAALVQKQFVLNFMTSYMPLLFTTFVYLPFGHVLIPALDFWRRTAQAITFSKAPLATREFQINPQRISAQMFYFTVTAQIVNLATELVVPYLKQRAFAKAKEIQAKRSDEAVQDNPEETEFMKRVRNEYEMDVYDVTEDYREMVMQFGYLNLFSVAWPLAPICFLVNNWVELRSDALKITTSCRRPVPWRADSIGPWLQTLGVLSWLGSVTSSAIVFLCSRARDGERGGASNVTAWGLLLSILLVEHFYFLAQIIVRTVLDQLESPGLQKERKERFQMKRQLLQDHLGQDVADRAAAPGIEMSEKITRAALEEDARLTSIRGKVSPAEAFWQRQHGMQETIEVGRMFITQMDTKNGKPASAAQPSPRA
ncbi:Anoctamin/TMEM 16 [Cordyceps fumosorosea ARSEF 2679]|uniref:Anoctamin/TMEM 16 n=1 Tax=Cordyceps fumosorosea (strain ARSEF 2679) TaxID=1081104 RepID=A0A167V804_CORFA|nr:Anoctamin/TMEM 16 [Cordyceps fumosorosea ARSEF 2679]OAA62328.1 Anoctamin/TMEM 16 [Cordyceps fumosorosea ARSEF 2679]